MKTPVKQVQMDTHVHGRKDAGWKLDSELVLGNWQDSHELLLRTYWESGAGSSGSLAFKSTPIPTNFL